MAATRISDVQVDTELIPLPRLLNRLAEGRIRVPRFQRPFVWERGRVLELLDSVRRQFPIGSILLWDSDQEYSSADQVGPITIPKTNASSYVLDGHQRLSALLGTLEAKETGEAMWRVAYDLEREEFFHLQDKPPSRPWIAVNKLLRTTDFLTETARLTKGSVSEEQARNLVRQAELVARAFRDYQIPIVRIKQADLPTAVNIFSRLNSRAAPISGDQLTSALTHEKDRRQLLSETQAPQVEGSEKEAD